MRNQVILTILSLLILAFAFVMPWQPFLGSISHQYSKIQPLHTSGDQILDASGNIVYLRGIGRTGDLQSASGMWAGPGDQVANCGQKWQQISSNVPLMDATFQCYQQVWHVNMIRIFVAVDWWWQNNVVPSQYDNTAYSSKPISYRSYIQTLVEQAAKYGIYVDFCPYSLVNYYTLESWNNGSSEGIPGSWSPGSPSASYMQNVTSGAGITEMQFWQAWWKTVVDALGKDPNVIFEMWNEPDDGTNTATSPTAVDYFSYVIQTYETIRSTGNTNLIFMQWHMSLIPTWTELSWVPQLYNQLKNAVNSQLSNMVFTTHPYRGTNLQWSTTYIGLQSQLNDPSMVPQTRSNGINVPLVFNEMGVLQLGSDGAEYSFWDAILHNARDMGIGVVAYYWISDTDYGPAYYGESLVTGIWAQGALSPTPNTAGQIFIKYGLNSSETQKSTLSLPPPIV